MKKLRIGFFASHDGSNMQAIIDNIKRRKLRVSSPEFLISNNSKCGAMERARNEGIPCYHISSATHSEEEATEEILRIIKKHRVNIICLTGYMKLLPEKVIDAMEGQVLNIHPSLLPKYGGKGMYGMKVHKAVIEAGEETTGATVHYVTKNYDEGQMLIQELEDIKKDDTPETIAKRVQRIEHNIYTEGLQLITCPRKRSKL